jgi:GAF domain-containing protein
MSTNDMAGFVHYFMSLCLRPVKLKIFTMVAMSSPLSHSSTPSHSPVSEASHAGSQTPQEGLPSIAELEQTLQRLVRRVAMLIQAEKCVFLLHDRERDELVARPPALGFTPDQIKALHVPIDAGVSGAVFTSGESMTIEDAPNNTLINQFWVEKLEVRNVLSQPLVIEHHDEQHRVTNREIVGVIHVINKRGGEKFSAEDLRLISIMARQITAVITNAQLYLRLTEEKEHLQATLQSLLSGVVMVESTGHVSLINPAARQMFGLKSNGPSARNTPTLFRNPLLSTCCAMP